MSTVLERPSDPVAERSSDPAVPGVKRLDPRSVAFQRRLVLVVTVLPFLGFAAAVWSFWGNGLTPLNAALFIGLYCVTALGVTVGYHRLFTHGSFEATPWARNLLAIAGSMATQGPVIRWVADHRRHHAFADQPGDPHSPHLDEGPGVKGVLRGLWHAHMGWLFSDEQTSARRWAPDLVRDPAMRKIDSLFFVWVALSLALAPAIGWLVTGTAAGALTAFIWGSLARIFFVHHVTWSVNSICHFYGTRTYASDDHSTNNWLLSLVSFGESWHNNHHAFPTSAVHGIDRGQIDLSAGLIRLMEKVGIAHNVKTVTDKQIDRKKTSA